MRRGVKIVVVIGSVVAGIIIIAAVLLTLFNARMMNYRDPAIRETFNAGFQEKQVVINGVEINYGEGPDNGPPLLMMHAQNVTWLSYAKVLPELSRSFHIFAPDCHGHGKTDRAPERYQANLIGGDMGLFIEEVIGEPVLVTGNSSGGILAAWLAAYRPDLVRAAVLEDPPLFTTEFPRITKTVAWDTFRICNEFLGSGEEDYLMYWIDHNPLVAGTAGEKNLRSLKDFIIKFREKNPDRPVEVSILPDMLRVSLRGMESYDPRFGAAFYDGTWNTGLDHAEMLRRIECPVLFVHADFYYEEGILMGALDEDDAERVVSLIPDAKLLDVDSGHTVHIDKPELFIGIINRFFK